MPKLTILIIDDEPQIRRVVRAALEQPETGVHEAATASEGVGLASTERPDLIVLDLGLPDRPGLAVCTALREFTHVPILVLTARHSDEEKATLLDAGADDYVTKPFSTVELQARVRALLRRAARAAARGDHPPAPRIEADGFAMDLGAHTLTIRGADVHLTPTEWDLLRALATQPGRVLTHRQLFEQVWRGRTAGDAQQYLRVYITHLRRKIEADPVRPRYIVTEPGIGYRFELIPAGDRGDE